MKIIDRYILKQFIVTLLFSFVALYAIFLIVDMIENLEEFLDNGMNFSQIAMYYIYFFPGILKLLVPVAMLLSTLFTVGRLSGLNEVTAIKTGGVSLYRFMAPLFMLSIIISASHLYFNGWIVPKANIEKNEIEREYMNKNKSVGSIYDLYFRETPTTNLHMKSYNSKRMEGFKVGLEYFEEDGSVRLNKTIEAKKIKWDTVNSNWQFTDAIIRTFEGEELESVERKDTMNIDLVLTHDKIISLKKSTDEMTLDELEAYLNLLKKGGRNVDLEMTDYYGQYAFPVANIIVVLFGVPFASVKKKGGIAVQIGAALVISFMYLIFTKVSQAIVLGSGLDPLIAGWFANGLFFVVGIVNLIKTKT